MTYFLTGASRGIGLEFAKQILESGAHLIATARNPESSAGLQALKDKFTDHCELHALDIASDESVQKLVESLPASLSLDVLINNGGIYVDSDSRLRTLEMSELEQTLQTNTIGPIRVTKALERFLNRADAPIVANLSSVMGSLSDNTSGGSYAYRISKIALNMFAKNLALEHKDWIVLLLHPGWVRTEMGGAGASVPPETSVRGLLEVIHSSTKASSGHFIDYRGKNLEW